MDSMTGVRQVDRVVAVFNGAMALVWTTLVGAAWYAGAIAVAHAAVATLPWLQSRIRRNSRVMDTFLDLIPLIILAASWVELDLLRLALPTAGYDQIILTMDHRIFGAHPHATWLPAMPHVWLSEVMNAFYFGYFPLLGLPALALLVRRRRDGLHDLTLRLFVTYAACYLVYLPFPVFGPYLTSEPLAGPHTDGLMYRIVAAALTVGDSPGTAFPSSHVAGAIAMAAVGWRQFSKPVAWLMSIEAVGILFATVYTQHHYGIDALAGLTLGLGVQLIVVPSLLRSHGAPATSAHSFLPITRWTSEPVEEER